MSSTPGAGGLLCTLNTQMNRELSEQSVVIKGLVVFHETNQHALADTRTGTPTSSLQAEEHNHNSTALHLSCLAFFACLSLLVIVSLVTSCWQQSCLMCDDNLKLSP